MLALREIKDSACFRLFITRKMIFSILILKVNTFQIHKFDSIPHSWLLKTLELYKIYSQVVFKKNDEEKNFVN